MPTMFLAMPHSPIIVMCARAPEAEPELQGHLLSVRAAIERFDPELILFFGTDHFAGFHLSSMPAYCVGLEACEAVADAGGFPGPLAVDRAAAAGLVAQVRDEGFDPAVSYKMTVDHAFSQPLHRLFGRNDRYPLVPIYISVLTPPFVPFRRSRRFGEAVGRFAARDGRRILILGSGGLSHHPTLYYPTRAEAAREVWAYELDGERGGGLTDAQWFERLLLLHQRGARMLVSGERTREDIHLNPEFDRAFLCHLAADEFAALDDLGQAPLIETAGVGAMELHAWVAAAAAYRASGGAAPMTTVYAPTLEYGIGYGMAYAA